MSATAVIASYKYGHLAAQAIESVLNQTVKFDRVMFVDDGIGDCKRLKQIYPEVEFILRKQNVGVVDNFNDMLSRVETDRVMFLGADNWLDHNTLELTSASSADIVSYNAWFVQDGPYVMWTPGVPHGSSLYNVAKAREVGCYESSGNDHAEEDSVLFAKMRANGATFEVINHPLLYYRWRHRLNYNK